MVAEQAEQNQVVSNELSAIDDEIAACTKCPLAQTRTNTVPGEGSQTAEVMFVGEGPGADEDRTGRPFVGRAGRLLDELIHSLPMRREDVYIANVVKCRPPDNRDPERQEVEQCRSYLERQIATVDPLVLVPLGRHALGWFLPNLKITASNGKIFRYGDRALMPLLHPSAGLRSPDNKRMLTEAIHNLPDAILEGIRIRRAVVKSSHTSADQVAPADSTEKTPIEPSAESMVKEDAPDMTVATIADQTADGVALFERTQTADEIQAELKQQREIEEAERNTDGILQSVEIDDRQSTFF